MDGSMDIDMDIDLALPAGDDQNAMDTMPLSPTFPQKNEPLASNETVETETVETVEQAPEKVYVRGVDDLTTDNVKAFATKYFSMQEPLLIEWINDTSANIVYSSPDIAAQALAALADDSVPSDQTPSPLCLRKAKPFPEHPESTLQVRIAFQTDKKQPKAREASRFYLLHPEYDRPVRFRREGKDRDNVSYRPRKYSNRENERRKKAAFDATMYDDVDDEMDDSSRADGTRRHNISRELFADRDVERGRLRNRSASPMAHSSDAQNNNNKNKDNSYSHSRRRFRDRSPPRHRNVRAANRSLSPRSRELFRARQANKELFPNKVNAPLKGELASSLSPLLAHRRSDAFDAADESGTAYRSKSHEYESSAQGEHTRPSSSQSDSATRTLQSDKLLTNITNQGEFNIKGASRRNQGHARAEPGFSIRGAANQFNIKDAAKSKELFPNHQRKEKVDPNDGDNVGKELFGSRFMENGVLRRRMTATDNY